MKAVLTMDFKPSVHMCRRDRSGSGFFNITLVPERRKI